jgi:GxxExxY protein
MQQLIQAKESYEIINKCFEVYNNLGSGFLEVIYKDAIAYEFKKAQIPFEREKQYQVHYKSTILEHCFYADFVVYGSIILEIKAVSHIRNEFLSQTINYLRASENKLALLVNFGESSLKYKRVVY